MKAMHALICAMAFSTASAAVAADRLTDRDVKALIDRIDQGRDRFEDALDGKLKSSVVRTPTGEVDVNKFLDDFQENSKRLGERLKPGYAASAEVATLLRQGNAIERFLREQPAGTKGSSEWNRLAADLKTLARAYGADFPLAENAAVRRIGDRELETSVEALAKGTEQLKGSLDKELKSDKTVTQQTRQQVVEEANQLSKDAKQLLARVKDSKPSSAEAEKVVAGATRLETTLQSHQVPQSAAAWTGLASRRSILSDAYGLQRPR
jgi:hypothetical protein